MNESMYTPLACVPAIELTSTQQSALGGIQGKMSLISSSGSGVRSGPRRTARTSAIAVQLSWCPIRAKSRSFIMRLTLHRQLSYPCERYLPRDSEHVERLQILLQRRSAKLRCRQAHFK